MSALHTSFSLLHKTWTKNLTKKSIAKAGAANHPQVDKLYYKSLKLSVDSVIHTYTTK